MAAQTHSGRPDKGKGKAKAKPSGKGQKKELERKILDDLQLEVDHFVSCSHPDGHCISLTS